MLNVTTKTWHAFYSSGHIKLVKGAVDPDPTEYLLPSMEMKREDQQKPYVPNFHLLNMLSNLAQVIQFHSKVWHQEVCLDHGRQDPCLQGGSPGIVNSRGDSFMQNWNPTMKFFIFLKNIQHSLCTIFVHFQGVRRHCFSWCWGRWPFRQDGRCRR